MDFGEYVTAAEACKLNTGLKMENVPLEVWIQRARSEAKCASCNQPAWRYGGLSNLDFPLCFSCTTGESDASEDYELLPEEINGEHETQASA